jgi:dethiobiotin synthetase
MIARSLFEVGWQVGVYKPAASGCRAEGSQLLADDAISLWEAAGRPGRLEQVCPQCFAEPLAPHLAARAAGLSLDTELLRSGLDPWREGYDVVVVEGAGGLMSPLSDVDYVADLANEFQLPLVVVTKNSLGMINQTLQTLIAAATYREGIDVAGIVINRTTDDKSDRSVETNAQELAARAVPPILAEVRFGATEFDREVDWAALAGLPR